MSNRRPSLLRTASRLLEDLLALVRLGLTSRTHLAAAENPFLRKQLALYQERRTKPRRPDPATRVALVVLSRWLDWRAILTVVHPDTLIRWHRQGWRLACDFFVAVTARFRVLYVFVVLDVGTRRIVLDAVLSLGVSCVVAVVGDARTKHVTKAAISIDVRLQPRRPMITPAAVGCNPT